MLDSSGLDKGGRIVGVESSIKRGGASTSTHLLVLYLQYTTVLTDGPSNTTSSLSYSSTSTDLCCHPPFHTVPHPPISVAILPFIQFHIHRSLLPSAISYSSTATNLCVHPVRSALPFIFSLNALSYIKKHSVHATCFGHICGHTE
jgi:hypothetical protein